MFPLIRIIISFNVLVTILTPGLCQNCPGNLCGPTKPSEMEPICTSAICHSRAKEYLANMKSQVDPCDNFFDYACGNWIMNHPPPKYAPEWSVTNLLMQNTIEIFRDLLQNQTQPRDPKYAQAKLVYDTCSKIAEYPRVNARTVTNEILSIGRYPLIRLWDLHNSYLQLTGESAFFDYLVLAHDLKEGIPILLFTEPESPYGAIHHRTTWKPDEEKVYLEFLLSIMKSLKLSESENTIKKRVKGVFAFRKKFNEIIQKHRLLKPNTFLPVTIQKLRNNFENSKLSYQETIPWVIISKILLHNLPTEIIETREIVALRRTSFFVQLVKLLGETPEDVLAGHVEMFFVERHLEMSTSMLKLLKATGQGPGTYFKHIRIDEPKRWEQCISSYNVQQVLSQLFVEERFPQSYEVVTRKLIQAVKSEIRKELIGCKWIDPNTRFSILKKLNTLKVWIGSPPWANSHDLTIPNASFDAEKNIIYVRGTMLISPVFDEGLPDLYNIASLGSTVGHELYHLIKDCGGYYVEYPDKTIKQTWPWPESVRKACFARKTCFINHFNKITAKELKNGYGLVAIPVDSTRTFNENFADAMGFEAAYAAYHTAVEEDRRTCATLPHFENFSCKKMFFIAFANTFCGVVTQKLALHNLKHETRSLFSVRINGVVSNNADFGTAFNCPIGSPMNPATKCSIWK